MTANMLSSHHESRPQRTVAEWLWPFVPMGIAAFSASALAYYHLNWTVFEVRSPLQQMFASIYRTVGFVPSMAFCLLTITWSTVWLVTGTIERPVGRLLRLLGATVMLGVFLNLGDGQVAAAPHKGALGAWLAETLSRTIGAWPGLVVVWAVTFASLLLATDFLFHEQFERLRRPAGDKPEQGVEPAAAEHLRGLADAVVPPASRAPEAAPRAAAAVARADDRRDDDPAPGIVMAGDQAASLAEAELEPEEQPSPTRRRSYFERRAEREGRSWRRDTDEEWVPAAPESQEIDNPESAPAGRDPGVGDLGAGLPAAIASTESAEPLAAAADDEEPGSVDAARPGSPFAAADDLEARLADEIAAELRRQRAEPIVFPDDVSLDARANDADDEERAPIEAADATDAIVPIPRAGLDEDAPRRADADGADFATAESATTSDEPRDDDDHATAASAEPVVPIPRPGPEPADPLPEVLAEADAPTTASESEPEPARQQQLFGAGLDEGLVQEAIELVESSRRASAVFLQRKLRIDYGTATELLAELTARGVVGHEGDTSGRVS